MYTTEMKTSYSDSYKWVKYYLEGQFLITLYDKNFREFREIYPVLKRLTRKRRYQFKRSKTFHFDFTKLLIDYICEVALVIAKYQIIHT